MHSFRVLHITNTVQKNPIFNCTLCKMPARWVLLFIPYAKVNFTGEGLIDLPAAMQHRCSCFLVLPLFQQTSFSSSWNSERISPAFISASFCCWRKAGSRSLYPGVQLVCGWHESSPWLHRLVVGPDSTGPVALPFPPPCGKRGLAAERILVCGKIMSPFHKRQPSFSLCRHVLVPQGGLSSAHYCTVFLILPPPFPSTTKKGKTEQIKVSSRVNSGGAGAVPTACSRRQQPPLPTIVWQKRPRRACLQLLLLVCQMDLIFLTTSLRWKPSCHRLDNRLK